LQHDFTNAVFAKKSKYRSSNIMFRGNFVYQSSFKKWASLALLLAAPVVEAQVITVGPNVNVSRLLGNQSETAIAINRLNPNQIAVSSNNIAGPLLFNSYTTDGGSTWAASSFRPSGGYDSWLGADSLGNIFLSYQVAQVTNVARSTDGGASYGAVFTIPGGGADHPELAIGPGATAGTNSIYLRDTTSANRVISATSTALGANSAFTVQTGLGAGNFGSTAVGPGGRTVFTSLNPAGGVGPTNMQLRYDADGTGPGGYVTQSSVATNVGGFRPIPAQPSRTIDAQVALQYNSTGGARNGELYMLYTQASNNTTNDTNIVFRRSTDNGATFSSEIRLNDDVGNKSQFFGRLALDQTTGNLASVWYDARNSNDNSMIELWGTVSTDGGTTWTPNFKISTGVTDGRSASIGGDPNELGDYIALDFFNGHIAAAWADSSNSTGDNPNGTRGLDVYFANILVGNMVSEVPLPPTIAILMIGLVGVVRAKRKGS
jgi:hypothetical protein